MHPEKKGAIQTAKENKTTQTELGRSSRKKTKNRERERGGGGGGQINKAFGTAGGAKISVNMKKTAKKTCVELKIKFKKIKLKKKKKKP